MDHEFVAYVECNYCGADHEVAVSLDYGVYTFLPIDICDACGEKPLEDFIEWQIDKRIEEEGEIFG